MVIQTKFLIDRLRSIRLRSWLLIAAAFHALITLLLFLIGHYHLLPNAFDENGTGLRFAADGLLYQRIISILADALRQGDLHTWLEIQAPFHCRLYSLVFFFPGSIVGYNILAAEPLNVVYYLAILTLVYLLGKEIFDSSTGFRAAAVVAIWPSFLLHSTQLIRDSLAIAAMLGLLLILVLIVGAQFTWRSGLVVSVSGVVVATLFWLTRANMWPLVFVELAITTVLLMVRIIRGRAVPLVNLAILALLFAAVLLIPPRLESPTVAGSLPPTPLIDITSKTNQAHPLWERLLSRITTRREGFKSYLGKSSNIDSDVRFNGYGDLVRYLPRAAEIGLFAPFPRMWFDSGTVGRLPRIVAGCETFVMYLLYVAAIVCVWKERRNLRMWMVVSFALTSMIGLGLVVINAGALFRLRYVFWMMIIVLATGSKMISDLRSQNKLASELRSEI